MSDKIRKPAPLPDPLAIDVGDIPIPDSGTLVTVDDEFPASVAYNFAFLGLGQCGGRIASSMYKIGYRRVAAVNTTRQDMTGLLVPDSNLLDLNTGGAGRDPELGAKAITGREEEINDLLQRVWGEGQVDYPFICFGAGGGTGAGIWTAAYDILKRRYGKVGAIVAMPKNEEGGRVAKNTVRTFTELGNRAFSPLMLIDNDKIKSLYPKTTVSDFWSVSNTGICSLLHLFNRLAGSSSTHKPLDRADFAALLASGIVVPGMSVLRQCKTGADIAEAIRGPLRKNMLANVDISKASVGACVFVGGPSVFDSLPIEFLDYAQTALGRLLAPGAVVYSAVYDGVTPDLRCYFLVGGLPMPAARLAELGSL